MYGLISKRRSKDLFEICIFFCFMKKSVTFYKNPFIILSTLIKRIWKIGHGFNQLSISIDSSCVYRPLFSSYVEITSTEFLVKYCFFVTANCSQYAHYVFNTLDQDHSGLISFEVIDFHYSSTFVITTFIINRFS